MINSSLGKSIENVAICSDIKLLVYADQMCKLAEMIHFIDLPVFSESFFVIEMRKIKSHIKKPFLVLFDYVIPRISIDVIFYYLFQ